MMSWKVGEALAAGNAVVLKPSERMSFSAVRLAELAALAGVPAGLLNIVQGDGRTVGDALTCHPLISKMAFTGSTRTGAAIMASCALQGPKPVRLELGSKSPQLVFDDALNINRLAGIITGVIAGNLGQVCLAGSRLIVQHGITQALVERRAARILGIVERARDVEAQMRCGGGLFDGGPGGSNLQPTLIEV